MKAEKKTDVFSGITFFELICFVNLRKKKNK